MEAIEMWVRMKAPNGMYLYSEKEDKIVKITTEEPSKKADWSVVDEKFKTEYDKRKAKEESENEVTNE